MVDGRFWQVEKPVSIDVFIRAKLLSEKLWLELWLPGKHFVQQADIRANRNLQPRRKPCNQP
jgi:hypothetical protein